MNRSRKKPVGPEPERRRHTQLREVIEELLDHIRELAGTAQTLSPVELEYSQQRLEWLADEAWRTLLETEAAAPEG